MPYLVAILNLHRSLFLGKYISLIVCTVQGKVLHAYVIVSPYILKPIEH